MYVTHKTDAIKQVKLKKQHC